MATAATFDKKDLEVLNPVFAEYLAYEPHATRVWHYSPNVLPGWLHTEEYVRALAVGTRRPETTDEEFDRALAVRMARRRLMETAEQVHLIIAEQVFWRQVDPEVPTVETMKRQIQRVQLADEDPNITVQVLPMDHSLRRGADNHFTVLTHPDHGRLLYREGFDSESLSFDPRRVREHEEHFLQLAEAAVDLPTYRATAGDRTPPAWLTS